MKVSREDFVTAARSFVKTPFKHQGRSRAGLDCGGLLLVTGHRLGITDFDFLGYASFPTDGKFEELLAEHTDYLGWERAFPFNFDGSELLPGDLLSFDYGNGEGTRHVAIVSRFDRAFYVVEAHNIYGVCEHALRPPFVNRKTRLKGWRVRELL